MGCGGLMRMPALSMGCRGLLFVLSFAFSYCNFVLRSPLRSTMDAFSMNASCSCYVWAVEVQCKWAFTFDFAFAFARRCFGLVFVHSIYGVLQFCMQNPTFVMWTNNYTMHFSCLRLVRFRFRVRDRMFWIGFCAYHLRATAVLHAKSNVCDVNK